MRLTFTLLCFTLLLPLQFSHLFAQNGLSFDGTDDYVQTGYDGVTGTADRSIEAWIKTTYVSTQEVIADYGNMNLGQRFTFNLIAGKLRCEIGGQGVTGTTVISDNQWHHVAVTYDNSASTKFRLYVDGGLEAAFNLTSVTMNTSSTTNFRIGRRIDNVNAFIGSIDEVRFWNKTLTPTEITQNMFAEFCSPDSNLVAYYKLNEGIAGGSNSGSNTTYDASGNGNNGTLQGFSLSGSSSNWVAGYPLTTGTLTSSIEAVGCDGSYVSPSGNYTWTTAGTYTDTIQSVTACDSIITIDLTFANSSSSQLQVSACASYTSPSGNYLWTESGTYHDTIPNAAGCDSLITLDVSILNTFSSPSISVCESYVLPSGSDTIFFSGVYHDTILNGAGCDSNMTITLHVIGNASSSQNVTACLSYTSPSGNQTWTSSGTYQDTLPSEAGCDSIITVFLTIDTVNTSVLQSGSLLSAQQQGASYQWVDCDAGFSNIAGATGKLFSPIFSGNYAVIVTLNGCSDTSECFEVEIVGIQTLDSESIQLYPNPTSGAFQIESAGVPMRVITIYAMDGRVVFSQRTGGTQEVRLTPELAPGSYYIHMENEAGKAIKQLIIYN